MLRHARDLRPGDLVLPVATHALAYGRYYVRRVEVNPKTNRVWVQFSSESTSDGGTGFELCLMTDDLVEVCPPQLEALANERFAALTEAGQSAKEMAETVVGGVRHHASDAIATGAELADKAARRASSFLGGLYRRGDDPGDSTKR
jgi:hypothetical protein